MEHLPFNNELMLELDIFFVEELKTARRYLRKIGYTKNHWNWANKDPNEPPRKPFNKDNRGPRGFNNYRSGYNRNA